MFTVEPTFYLPGLYLCLWRSYSSRCKPDVESYLTHSLTVLGGGQGRYLVCTIWMVLDVYKSHCYGMNNLSLSDIRKNSLEALWDRDSS